MKYEDTLQPFKRDIIDDFPPYMDEPGFDAGGGTPCREPELIDAGQNEQGRNVVADADGRRYVLGPSIPAAEAFADNPEVRFKKAMATPGFPESLMRHIEQQTRTHVASGNVTPLTTGTFSLEDIMKARNGGA